MQALAALILVVTTAGATVDVPLAARLIVTHREVVAPAAPPLAGSRAPRPAPTPTWVVAEHASVRSAEAHLGGKTYTADVRLASLPGDAGAQITVTITYLADVRVEREALELQLPATAVRAVWRDGRLADAPALLRIDRWTPRVCLVRTGGVTLLVDGSGAEGMEIRREGGQVVVRLELDDEANHPFVVEPACRARWRGAAHGVAEGARLRLRGERAVYRARLHQGETPLLVDRLRAGQRAAVVFSDHADQTTAVTLRALLRGVSDERDARFGRGGFLGHGLALTKAFFWRGAPGRPQLESAAVAGLAGALRDGGGEVALHGPTPRADPRARTAVALRRLRDLGGSTWIDHQPPTNCEAFTNRGWRPDARYGIVDLLAAAGVRYVWAAGPEPRDELDLLRPREPGARTPFLYPWAAPTREGRAAGLYLFRSAWAYVERDQLLGMLSPPSLDRLEADRGVAILHTYLEALRGGRRLRARNLVRREPGTRGVALDPGFDAVLADLARRQQSGRVWVAALRDLADHLRGIGGVTVRYGRDGGAWVRNEGTAAVRGATLRTPRAGARLEAAGAVGARADDDGAALWLDLAPGAEVRVRARDQAGRALSFVTPARFGFRAPPAAP